MDNHSVHWEPQTEEERQQKSMIDEFFNRKAEEHKKWQENFEREEIAWKNKMAKLDAKHSKILVWAYSAAFIVAIGMLYGATHILHGRTF